MTVLDVSAEEYHAGIDERPRLSASIAHILWTKTPLHAWTAHPRLNPHYVRTEEEKFDLGKVAHSILLEGDDCVYVVHEDSWRKNVAKEAREYARSIGKVPLLAAARDDVMRMVDAVREKLDAIPAPPLFVDGRPEVSLAWSEGTIDFKARLDWLSNDCTRIRDLKTTSQIDRFERRLFDFGGDIQAAMYRRSVQHCFDVRADYLWVAVEIAPPYEVRLVRPGADVLAAGERKLEHAIATWRACMATGSWPGYPREVVEAELPAWEESRLLERETREEVAA